MIYLYTFLKEAGYYSDGHVSVGMVEADNTEQAEERALTIVFNQCDIGDKTRKQLVNDIEVSPVGGPPLRVVTRPMSCENNY